ncbi:MAG: dephospho-CoA kinase, partial [Chloroflexota bacterium]
GGSGDLGAAICRTLAGSKMDVAVTFVGEKDRAQHVVAEVDAAGCRGWAVQLDQSTVDQPDKVIASVVEHFGRGVLAADGELDRAKLGQLVFNDPEALRQLELLVHPAVRDEERRRILDAPSGTVLVVDAIKLFESGMADSCDTVWAVTAPAEQQLERLRRQRAKPADVAWQRIRAQPPQEEKARLASVVIDNGGSLDDTQRQVDKAWQKTAATWLRERQATP